MFKHDKHTEPFAGAQTIIAQGVKVEGDFLSQGDVIIDGEVAGTLTTGQSLKVGPTAVIQANVSAKSAIVAGVIQGNIHVDEMLELLETSRVHGDVEATTLSIASGAKVNGRLSMNDGEDA